MFVEVDCDCDNLAILEIEKKHFCAKFKIAFGLCDICAVMWARHETAAEIFWPLNFNAIIDKSSIISSTFSGNIFIPSTKVAADNISDIFKHTRASWGGSSPASPWGTCSEGRGSEGGREKGKEKGGRIRDREGGREGGRKIVI